MDDAEKMRLKRLAKIAKQHSQQSPSQQPSSNPTPTPSPKPIAKPSPPPPPPPAVKPTPQETARPVTPVQKVVPPVQASKAEIAKWHDESFTSVLKCTVNRDLAVKSPENLVYLKGLNAELEAEEPSTTLRPFTITPALLDRVLVARLSIDPDEMTDDDDVLLALSALPQISTFHYLLDCWKRAQALRRDVRSRFRDPQQQQERFAEIDSLKALIVSYAGLILTMPDMFPQFKEFRDKGAEQLVPLILAEPDTSAGLPSGFLTELAVRFDGDDLETILAPIATGLSAVMRDKNIFKEWQPAMQALTNLVENKTIAANIHKSPAWNPPNTPPRAIEIASIMGPFCRLNAFPLDFPEIAQEYFTNADQRTQSDLLSSINSLRGLIKVVQSELFTIFNQIVRASPDSREATLNYWSEVVKLNKKRGGLQVDPLTVSSDSFMVNLAAILLQFASPFLDAQYSKIDKIDMHYFSKSHRLDFGEETKIKATTEEAGEFYKVAEGATPPNFISDIFYICIALLHYGPMKVIVDYDHHMRQLQDMKKQYEKLKAEQPNWAGTPLAAQSDNLVERLRVEIDKKTAHQYATDAVLLDPVLLTQFVTFYNLVMTWLLRVLDPKHQHPQQTIELPLPAEPNPIFSMLPEFFVEDICELFVFIGKHDPSILETNSKNELVIFITTILNNTTYVKNPYLKAKLVEILFYNSIDYRGKRGGPLGDLINSHPFVTANLMPALMSFYSEVEQTGVSSQFYDKFNIRYNISQIVFGIWDNPVHRQRLRQESLSKMESFVRFVNLMMNDATYLLDESLTKLTEIRNYQREMADTEAWNAQPQREREEREGFYAQAERQAQSYNALGNETIRLLREFTKELPAPFMVPEIVERLAAMLDYNLSILTGPKCQELKVDNMDKYRFTPKRLLADIVDIYLNLGSRVEFVEAVAREGRSYSKDLFDRASGILVKRSIKTEIEVRELRDFVDRVEIVRASDLAGEQELGEIPDEFLDPLLYTLMSDPVTLPSSKITMDRSSIKSCLLSDPIDPFNRSPLKIEDVIPNTALKAQIVAFLKSKRGV